MGWIFITSLAVAVVMLGVLFGLGWIIAIIAGVLVWLIGVDLLYGQDDNEIGD